MTACSSDLDDNEPAWVNYEPYALIDEPPTRSGQSSEYTIGRYQWTREGLKGVDVAGRELLNTKQPPGRNLFLLIPRSKLAGRALVYIRSRTPQGPTYAHSVSQELV